MKRRISILTGIALISSLMFGLDGQQILEKVDRNMTAKNQVIESTMVIHGRRSARSITAKSWVVGEDKAFTEYLSPAREKGTKMLKLGDELWIYTPMSDRIIKIAGHMLRQSVMGSDLSYEDMMTEDELSKAYSAIIQGEEKILDRPAFILALTARSEESAYATRRIWVDKDRFIVLKEERFAKSGKLLKTTSVKEVMKVDNRWYPKHIIIKDELKTGEGTEFIVNDIQFNRTMSAMLFTKASLRR